MNLGHLQSQPEQALCVVLDVPAPALQRSWAAAIIPVAGVSDAQLDGHCPGLAPGIHMLCREAAGDAEMALWNADLWRMGELRWAVQDNLCRETAGDARDADVMQR